MAGVGRPSMQELVRRRRGGGLIGRRAEQDAYRENLGTAPGDPEHRFLFHVSGAAGVGKTSLVRLFQRTAEEHRALTAYVDDHAHSVLDAMEEISAQFAQQGHPLKEFDKALARYRQRRHEADAVTGDPGTGEPAPPSAGSSALASAGLAGLELLPVVGTFAARAADPDQLAQGMDRWRAALSARLRSHEDVQLVLAPLRVLTPVFLECLNEVAARVPWVALFFDTYERTGPQLDGWLRELMFGDRYGEMPANALVTLSGQPTLDPACWGDCGDLITELPLTQFTEAEARQLLEGKGIRDERVVSVILQLSGCLPVLVSMLAETRPNGPEDIGDPSGTAVERFLKWITDPVRRTAALAGALPPELDEDLFRTVAAEEATELYDWLRALPFVRDDSGRCRYHDVVRAAMLRVQRNQSPQRWRELHIRLAEFWERRCAETESVLDEDDFWGDEQWHAQCRNEAYHLLCADPQSALPGALRYAVGCLGRGVTDVRRAAEMLMRAGTDAGSEPVHGWGQRLLDALAGPETEADAEHPEYRALLRLARLLLAQAPLDEDTRAMALHACGVYRRETGDPQGALGDLRLALDLAPDRHHVHEEIGHAYGALNLLAEAESAYTSALELSDETNRPVATARLLLTRGSCRNMRGRREAAVEDLDRAHLLRADDLTTLILRGSVLYGLNRYEEALADLDRALALSPDDVVALSWRARARGALGRGDEALDDYEQVLRAEPTRLPALIGRGLLHRRRERHEEALSDFSRLLELDPDDARAWAERGCVYEQLGRLTEALQDFDESLRLSPDSTFVLGRRAVVHVHRGDLAAAEADLTAALSLTPDANGLLASRASVRRRAGRLEEALADNEREVALHPNYGGAHAGSARTLMAMHRVPEAIDSWGRALALVPEDADYLAQRALCHRFLGSFDEALSDCAHALRLDPERAPAVRTKASVYRRTGRLEEALPLWNLALERDAQDDRALAGRALTHEYRGEPVLALADFDAAIELNGTDQDHLGSRARCHRLAGRYQQAREDLDRAHAVARTDGDTVYLALESALLAYATDGPGPSRAAWEQVAAPSPTGTSGTAAGRLSLHLLTRAALADWPAAEAALAELCALDPYWELRADTLRELRQLALAPGPEQPRLHRLVERLAERWPDADVGRHGPHNPRTSVY